MFRADQSLDSASPTFAPEHCSPRTQRTPGRLSVDAMKNARPERAYGAWVVALICILSSGIASAESPHQIPPPTNWNWPGPLSVAGGFPGPVYDPENLTWTFASDCASAAEKQIPSCSNHSDSRLEWGTRFNDPRGAAASPVQTTVVPSWELLNATNAPPDLYGATMVYDPLDGYVLAFGGQTAIANINLTWTYSAGNWTQLHPTNSPPFGPSPMMVWDNAIQAVLLFVYSDAGQASTWRFSGRSLDATPSGPSTLGPPLRPGIRLRRLGWLRRLVRRGHALSRDERDLDIQRWKLDSVGGPGTSGPNGSGDDL